MTSGAYQHPWPACTILSGKLPVALDQIDYFNYILLTFNDNTLGKGEIEGSKSFSSAFPR